MGVPRGGWYFKRGNNLGEAKVGKGEGAKETFSNRRIPKKVGPTEVYQKGKC